MYDYDDYDDCDFDSIVEQMTASMDASRDEADASGWYLSTKAHVFNYEELKSWEKTIPWLRVEKEESWRHTGQHISLMVNRNYDVCNAWPLMQSLFSYGIVDEDVHDFIPSYVSPIKQAKVEYVDGIYIDVPFIGNLKGIGRQKFYADYFPVGYADGIVCMGRRDKHYNVGEPVFEDDVKLPYMVEMPIQQISLFMEHDKHKPIDLTRKSDPSFHRLTDDEGRDRICYLPFSDAWGAEFAHHMAKSMQIFSNARS